MGILGFGKSAMGENVNARLANLERALTHVQTDLGELRNLVELQRIAFDRRLTALETSWTRQGMRGRLLWLLGR